MASPPATGNTDASRASTGSSSSSDQQPPQQQTDRQEEPGMQTASTDGPALVQGSKQWTIPTAHLKPSPGPPRAQSDTPSSPSGSHVDIPKMRPVDEGKPAKNHINIPKITPMSSTSEPSQLAVGLDGKYVDEFGNILDWDGSVLGRVEGDLPSMIGRPVSKSGKILDEDGEVVGYVCENYVKPTLKALGGGLQVDSTGKIYDGEGNEVGNLNNTKNAEKLLPGRGGGGSADSADLASKPNAAPKPSEIYLDVKSTHDGIQLIIKIPTVFKQEESGTSTS